MFSRFFDAVCTLQIYIIIVNSDGTSRFQGDPDVALLVGLKESQSSWEMVCVVKGNASTSALVYFSHERNLKFSYASVGGSDYGGKVTFGYHNWDEWHATATVVGKYPILDYRWEEMQSFITNFEKFNPIAAPAHDSDWILNLSAKGKSDIHIHLCTDNNLSSRLCHWIILGGVKNTISGYRHMKFGKQLYNRTGPGGIEVNRWNAITLEVSKDFKVKVQLGKIRVEPNATFPINYVVFATNKYGRKDEYITWRIHNKIIRGTINQSNAILSSGFTPLNKNSVCLSFFYYIPSSVPNAKLVIQFRDNSGDLQSTYISNNKGEENSGWKRFKETFTLNLHYGNTYVWLSIKAEFDGEFPNEYPQDLFAIDDVKLCSPGGDIRKVVAVVKTEDISSLSCQLLQFPDLNLTAREPEKLSLGCPAGHLLSNCAETCGTLFGNNRYEDCTYAVICVPENNHSVCACSHGHEGPSCTKCGLRTYGDGCSNHCGSCLGDRNCHWATGVCPDGCRRGYATDFCNETFPFLKKAPVLVDTSPSSISFTVDFTDLGGHGQPTSYQIQFKKSYNPHEWEWRNDNLYSISVSSANTTLTLGNLEKLSEYEIRVILFVNLDSYDDEDIPTVTGTTTCEDVEVLEPVVGNTSVEVMWTIKDVRLNCPLAYYSIELSGEDISTGGTQYFRLGRNTRPVFPEYTSLEPYTTYSVTVFAQNKVLFNKKVTTLESAPTEPVELNAVPVSGFASTVSWKNPVKRNGKLIKFSVVATVKETWLLKSTVHGTTDEYTVTEERKSYTLQLAGLHPSTSYVVFVSGVTVAEGKNNSVGLLTPLVKPVYTEQLALAPGGLNLSTAKIFLPPASEYLTNTSAYFVMVGCDKCLEEGQSSVPFPNGVFWSNLLNHSQLADCDDKWIAGEIQPKFSEMNFTIGSNTKSDGHIFGKGYVNRPLQSRTSYNIVMVVVSQQEESIMFETLKLQQGSLNLYDALNMTDDDTSDTGISSVLIVFIILLAIIIPILGYFIYRRRKIISSISKTKLPVQFTNQTADDDDSYILKPAAPDPSSESDDNDDSPQMPLSERLSLRVAIADLENYILRGISSGELQKQYQRFPRGQTQPWDYGKLPQNKPKNRYGNLIAYDNTRVILKKLSGDEYSDYINANYIDGYNSKKMYIATQGPKPNSVDDFWRMVWQEQVHIISMLANLLENGKKKCEHYWPDNGKESTYGAVTVSTENEQVLADFTTRNLKITCEGKERRVVHLHFTSWPDHGVPFYAQSVAGYLKKLLATPKGPGPILVHCSAGVGRTGTIILADICLRMAAAERAVDILRYVQSIREQRPNMVDNFEQYKLVHQVLIECLVEEQTSYPCNGLVKHIKVLKEAGTFEKQFQRLEELRTQNNILLQDDVQPKLQPGQSPLLPKNRFQDIVPGRSGRVYLARNAVQGDMSDYINAVYVDGFRIRDQFIVTQYPLPSTVGDFWRMVVEKNISLIVMLNDLDLSETVVEFRPINNEEFSPVPHLKIKLKQKSHTNNWSLFKFQITDSSASTGTSQHQVVRMIHLTGWSADQDAPCEPSVLIHLLQEMETHYSGKGPTLLMCLDGARACGLFLAAAFLIEKIKLEQQCDVCHAVRTIRQNRKHFIRSQDQLEFLYDTAVSYLEEFSIYSNFD